MIKKTWPSFFFNHKGFFEIVRFLFMVQVGSNKYTRMFKKYLQKVEFGAMLPFI